MTEFRIIASHKNAHKAEGLAVVIDVIRAFTTASYILHNGAKAIIPIGKVNDARNLKRTYPQYLLVGERMGIKLPGFDFGNSPTEIKNVDMHDKTVIMTTTAGTQGIVKARKATSIITAAFVNAGAVISYIKRKSPPIVSFICTDDRWKDSEDFLCAQYIERALEGNPIPFPSVREKLEMHISVKLFLASQLTPYAREDLDRCFALDTFNFVSEVRQINSQAQIIKV